MKDKIFRPYTLFSVIEQKLPNIAHSAGFISKMKQSGLSPAVGLIFAEILLDGCLME